MQHNVNGFIWPDDYATQEQGFKNHPSPRDHPDFLTGFFEENGIIPRSIEIVNHFSASLKFYVSVVFKSLVLDRPFW
jgi:hypothetical protein